MNKVKRILYVLIAILAINLLFPNHVDSIYADNSDFVIDNNNVLVKYNGTGGIIEVPSGVTEIGKKAFAGNKTLNTVKLPNTVKVIGESAFDSCAGLVKVNLPDSLEIIKQNAFWGCTDLKEVVIPTSVEEIEFGAFCLCESLNGIYIPSSVKTIGNYAFGYLYYGTNYHMADNYSIMGENNSAAKEYADKYRLTFLTKGDLTAKLNTVVNLKKLKAKVTWYRNSNVSGYQIQYATNKKFSKAKTVTVSADNGSKTISSMKKGKTYYFRVRGYRTVAGTKYYSDWSTSKSIKIKK